ncbi:hypothetical protein HFO89_10985 [Rhizobium leguminosarum]|uniref:hypothetical protein n=1 Tax=Rhizobium leguminosarum TaxID=384 RepID=UPI001C97FD55|nr:hypothetical protein [Rhizobium leguminosarum]MBY5456884.1 hypothetical protein [Rhizobium leguminosarum]
MDRNRVYEGLGATLEEAVEKAHVQIPPQPGTDYTISRVVDWGMQFGGFVGAKLFYAKVFADDGETFKTES